MPEQFPPCRVRPIAYQQRLETRPLDHIDLVVIHCTELPDLAMAREWGERIHYAQSGTGNCGHYYIDRDGSAEQWVADDRIAHHVRGYNERSIGIELVNRGRYPDWLHSGQQKMTASYPQVQVAALIAILRQLLSELPTIRWIDGHEYLDTKVVPSSDNPAVMVRRKRDPGPMFPWPDIIAGTGLEAFQQQQGT